MNRTRPVRVEQASIATGVSEPTIHRWCREHWMTYSVISKVRYVRIEEVEDLRDTLKARSALRYLTR